MLGNKLEKDHNRLGFIKLKPAIIQHDKLSRGTFLSKPTTQMDVPGNKIHVLPNVK